MLPRHTKLSRAELAIMIYIGNFNIREFRMASTEVIFITAGLLIASFWIIGKGKLEEISTRDTNEARWIAVAIPLVIGLMVLGFRPWRLSQDHSFWRDRVTSTESPRTVQ